MKPITRWCGGKAWIAPRLAAMVTAKLAPCRIYYEPFVGGGAVALALPESTRRVLGDKCRAVSGLWWWLQRSPASLASVLSPENWSNTEAGYYQVREQFNATNHFDSRDPTPSAMFLWLNRTCFNGVFRENSKGEFNVPWGKLKRPKIPTYDEIIDVGFRIRKATVHLAADFADQLRTVQRGDVVFADPPYDDVFADYTSESFKGFDQERLASVLESCRSRGAFVMMTNSDTSLIRSLYVSRYWDIEEVQEPRRVSQKATERTPAACVLVTSK